MQAAVFRSPLDGLRRFEIRTGEDHPHRELPDGRLLDSRDFAFGGRRKANRAPCDASCSRYLPARDGHSTQKPPLALLAGRRTVVLYGEERTELHFRGQE